jgi:multiple sugar transport system ATP-binding protein
VIQQIDTPMNLYDRPANLFVAGFLGSPAMNMLRGTLRHAGGWQLEMAASTLALGELTSEALDVYRDRELVVGVRPEDLQPVGTSDLPPDMPRLTATVEVIEPVGNEVFLNMHYAGDEMVARAPPQSLPQAGSQIELAFSPARLHFFDPRTGVRVDVVA